MASSLDTLAFSGTELTDAQLEQADGGMLCLILLALFYGGLIAFAIDNS